MDPANAVRRGAALGLKHVAYVAIAFVFVLPLWWAVVSSLRPNAEVFADLFDELVHVVPGQPGIGVLGGDDGEVGSSACFDDEQQSAVELGHGLADSTGPVTELHRRTVREALHSGGDGREVVCLVGAEPGGVAQLEAVPGEHESVAGSGGAFQEIFQEPTKLGEIHQDSSS